MEETLEIKEGESKIFGDLEIKNNGGGHKILMGKKGERAGDLSFANIILKTSKMEPAEFSVSLREREKEEIFFDNYKITVQEVGWNGQFVKLAVGKNNQS